MADTFIHVHFSPRNKFWENWQKLRLLNFTSPCWLVVNSLFHWFSYYSTAICSWLSSACLTVPCLCEQAKIVLPSCSNWGHFFLSFFAFALRTECYYGCYIILEGFLLGPNTAKSALVLSSVLFKNPLTFVVMCPLSVQTMLVYPWIMNTSDSHRYG